MRIAVLFSGGKDSTRTTHWCIEKGLEIEFLVTMIPKRQDSWMYHTPNLHIVDKLSEAIGIPLIKKNTSGKKEEEVEDLYNILQDLDIDGIATGGIASNYQKTRIEGVCSRLGLELIAPFWGYDQRRFLEETIKLGFDVRFVGVYSLGFSKDWLGRKLDENILKQLLELEEKYGINLVGEGGDYETLVLDGPIFKKKIIIEDSEIIWDEKTSSGYLMVKKVKLSRK
ncbi:MAG: TIGR00289 family protein [Candidatus Aenigmatarchaeota archaeon]